jgi:hypothetical protein
MAQQLFEQGRLRRLVATSSFDRSVAVTGDNLYGIVARSRMTSELPNNAARRFAISPSLSASLQAIDGERRASWISARAGGPPRSSTLNDRDLHCMLVTVPVLSVTAMGACGG